MPPKRKAQPKSVPKGKQEDKKKVEETKVPDTSEGSDEEVPVKKVRKTKQTKVPKGKQGDQKKVEENKAPDVSDGSDKEVAVKKPRKAKQTKNEETKPIKTAPLNATNTAWDTINFNCTKKNSKGQEHSLKITSWNVDGVRAWLKKDGLSILTHDGPDIFCIQETKCSLNKLPEELKGIEGYKDYWCSSDREGYAGVGVYSKTAPLKVIYGIENKKHDNEGRCITLEFKNFYLVNVYVPNAGRGLVTLPKRLDWNESFKAFIKKLDKVKPVIVCGDMNVAHNEIDLTNPKTNKKNAGFTQEERDGMTDFLEDGYADSFRKLYPEETGIYTFWSYMNKARSKNVGWRLDYFIVSEKIMGNVCDQTIRNEVFGSDHCPITLFINI